MAMKLSVVIPAFNEQDNVLPLTKELVDTLTPACDELEIVWVDDGSRDKTLERMQTASANDDRVRYRSLSRNFGHEAATTAGLDAATGDAVVVMDADFQDPPKVILGMLAKWRDGAEVVLGTRRTREGETKFKLASAHLFYRVFDWLSDEPIALDTGDFRLMDRAVVETVKELRETPRFMRGIFGWAGYRIDKVEYDRPARAAGETKYDIRKLVRLGLDALAGHSLRPLRMILHVGSAVLAVGMLGMAITLIASLFGGGLGIWFLASAMTLLAGVQLVALGVVALYMGHATRNSQRRPVYALGETSESPRHARPKAPEAAPAVEPKPMEAIPLD